MKPTNYEKVAGNDFVMNLAFTLSGSAVNITNYTILFTLKKDRLLTDTDTGVIRAEGTIVSGVGGTALVTIPASTTSTLDGSYYYDLKYIDGDGLISTFGFGVVTFLPRTTIREA